jgi:hypothetical protein
MRSGKVVLTALMVLGVAATSVVMADDRGGWPDQTWDYIYEARLGEDVAGPLGNFDDLDGSWDDDNPYSIWFGDDIATTPAPGGAETYTRTGRGDNEGGTAATDAETLGTMVMDGAQSNSRIYFERFLTDGGDTGTGNPILDFSTGATIITRFRYFSLDDLVPDPDDLTQNEAFRRSLGIPVDDDVNLANAAKNGDLLKYAGTNEYDESPREIAQNPDGFQGMGMVSRGDIYTSFGGGPGGVYWGICIDGDDSWDPLAAGTPPTPATPVDVHIAFIVAGPADTNATYQMSDAYIVQRLEARGAQVTVLDQGDVTAGTGGHFDYVGTSHNGPQGVAEDHDLVIISSTIGSNNVTGAGDYRNYDVPLIMWESGLGGKYDIATDGGLVLTDTTDIQVSDNTHAITSGLSTTSPTTVYANGVNRNMSYIGFSIPSAGHSLAHHPSNASLHNLVVYDPAYGGTLADGTTTLTANQRWVFMWHEDDTFFASTADALTMFDRAVEWTLGPTKAALLGAAPAFSPPPGPNDWKPAFYINLGATPLYEAFGETMYTKVLTGNFLVDVGAGDPTVPLVGGGTRVYADLPTTDPEDFVSVYITVEPEASPPPGSGLPNYRVKVYFNGGSDPVIEIQNHHLDPTMLPAVGNGGANDGTGMGMGLWRNRAAGYLDVDYFGVLDSAVPPPSGPGCNTPPQDSDGDGDVDLSDYGNFLDCYNGPNRPHGIADVCPCFDTDDDGDVDLTDYGAFLDCYNGPNRAPAC